MSVPFLVSDIIERTRVRCALPAFTADTNISTSDILTLVQESARALSGLLDRSDWYFATTAQLNTLAGIAVVSLPTNFASLLQLHWDKGDGQMVPIGLANLEDVKPSDGVLNWQTTCPEYRLSGNTLEFFPTPDQVYDLVCRYTTGIFITTAADTLFGQVGWDEWVLYDCCCKIRQAQDKDYSSFAAERAQKLEDIRGKRRDRAGVTTVRDVRATSRETLAQPWAWWKQ